VTAPRSGARRTLAELSAPSEPGNERQAMEEIAAVAEATMNAMEHGNYYRAELPVIIENHSSTCASTAGSMTRRRRWKHSPPGYGTRWIWSP
jgi:anti-sigma regulatory factor (Ser/Thr protein kinase)